MSEKQIPYNIDKIDEENANINIILGEKSNGKSYQVKHKKGIRHYLGTHLTKEEKSFIVREAWTKENHRFILMRRWREDISNLWIEQYFADVDVLQETEGKYNTINCYRKVLYLANYDVETGKITRGEKIGYVMALSTEQHMSSASFLDVDMIIFEEFIERGIYIAHEPDKLMIFYSTIDRKRGTTKLYLVGNSISRVCPYINAWGLDDILRKLKQGEIATKEIQTENTKVKIAIEYCKSSGGKSVTIGNASKMIDSGSWQTFPQPHLPKSYNEYNPLFQFGFQYKSFKFLCELLQDKSNKNILCWFIYPFYKDFSDKLIIFSDIIKTEKNWQRDIYNITYKNEKLRNLFQTFRETNIFYSSDLCGTDFKQVIDFTIRR